MTAIPLVNFFPHPEIHLLPQMNPSLSKRLFLKAIQLQVTIMEENQNTVHTKKPSTFFFKYLHLNEVFS